MPAVLILTVTFLPPSLFVFSAHGIRHRRRHSGTSPSRSGDESRTGSPRPDESTATSGDSSESPRHHSPVAKSASISATTASQLANSSVFTGANLPRLGVDVTTKFSAVIQAAVETNTNLTQGQGMLIERCLPMGSYAYCGGSSGSQSLPKLQSAISGLVGAIQRTPVGRSFDFSRIQEALKDAPQLQAPVLLVHTLILADARQQAKMARAANPSMSQPDEISTAARNAKAQGVPLISEEAVFSQREGPGVKAAARSKSDAPEREFLHSEPVFSSEPSGYDPMFPPSPGMGRSRGEGGSGGGGGGGGSGSGNGGFNPPSILTGDTHMDDMDGGPDSTGLGSLGGLGGASISPFDSLPLPLISPSSPARHGGTDDYLSFMAIPSPGKKPGDNEPYGSGIAFKSRDDRRGNSSMDPYFDMPMSTSPVHNRRELGGSYLDDGLGGGDLDMDFEDSRDTWSESHTFSHTPTNTSATGFSTTDGGEGGANDSPELRKALKTSRNALGTLSLEDRNRSPIYVSRQMPQGQSSANLGPGPHQPSPASASGGSFSSSAVKREAPTPLFVGEGGGQGSAEPVSNGKASTPPRPSPASEEFLKSFLTGSPSGRLSSFGNGQ